MIQNYRAGGLTTSFKENFVFELLTQVEVPSLPGSVVQQIERLILQGKIKPGRKLPPERDLAVQLGVSRPVVHAAILDLEQKGLVTIRPRHGTWVNDYRISGSAELLVSLWRNGTEELEPAIVESALEFRVAVEEEAAARIALRPGARSGGEICLELTDILDRADALPEGDAENQADLDYAFHFAVALHSGNLIYPMVMNSFHEVYIHLLRRFFEDRRVVAHVRSLRHLLLDAICTGNPDESRRLMHALSEIGTYDRDT